jgi:putative PIN family toxin of toxin-antitoxin system
MIIVLDSNVIIAAFATRGLCSNVFELCLFEHKIIISKTLLNEVYRGLRKKIKLPKSIRENIISFLKNEAHIVVPKKVPNNVCRDPDDAEILGTALAGNVDIIITGDKDLLILKQFKSIPILTLRGFWKFIQKKK